MLLQHLSGVLLVAVTAPTTFATAVPTRYLSPLHNLPDLSTRQSAASLTLYPNAPFAASTLFSVVANKRPVTVQTAGTFDVATFASTAGSIAISFTYLATAPLTAYSLHPAGPDISLVKSKGSTVAFQLMMGSEPRKIEVRVNTAVTSIAPKQIYLAPGSLVNVALWLTLSTGVTISGRGFLRNSIQTNTISMIQLNGCSNIIVRDIHTIESGGNQHHISGGDHFLFDNIKAFQYQANTDGFRLLGPVNNFVLQNSLIVNHDNVFVLGAGNPNGPYNNTIRNSVFDKISSGGSFMYLQGYAPYTSTVGNIGLNTFTSLDILRISGEDGLVTGTGLPGIALGGIILDQIRVVTPLPRIGSAPGNRLLSLTPTINTTKVKTIIIQNSAFPAGFNGSVIAGPGWAVTFRNVSLVGVPVVSDRTAEIVGSVGTGSTITYL
ncbi:hypothetical protein RQP46_010139 [Phenoliferia psychrophenolica]